MTLPPEDFVVLGIEEIPIVFPPESTLGRTFALWKKWAGERDAPTWRDVELYSLPPEIVPLTLVVDVVEGGKDYRYRFWGTGFTEHYGLDETGVYLSQAIGPNFVSASFMQLGEVVQAKRPRAFTVTMKMPKTGVVAHKTNLRMPIIDASGTVTQVMSVSIFEESTTFERDKLSRIIARENKIWKE